MAFNHSSQLFITVVNFTSLVGPFPDGKCEFVSKCGFMGSLKGLSAIVLTVSIETGTI